MPGVRRLDLRDVQAELEARAAPRDPGHAVAEALLRERLAVAAVARAIPLSGVQVVDVCRAHEPCMAVSMLGAAPPRPCRQ
jgi:hypothetical protein